MKDQNTISGYRYSDATHSCAHAYLMPTLKAELQRIKESSQGGGSLIWVVATVVLQRP